MKFTPSASDYDREDIENAIPTFCRLVIVSADECPELITESPSKKEFQEQRSLLP